MTTHKDLIDRDRKVTFHASTHLRDFAQGDAPGRVITGGKGIKIVDKDGREFIDGFAGLYCVNIGYGRSEVAEAIYQQALEMSYYHTYVGHSNEPQIALSEKILELAGPGMSKVYYGMSGSDANETQLKIVRYYNNVLGRPQKKKVISRMRGYHGSGIASGSLTGLKAFHDHFDLPIETIRHTEAPYYYHRAAEQEGMTEREFSKHCAAKLEEMILFEGPDTVAAFIGEPVLGTGGIVPPPEGYWDEIQAVLAKYDVLLIADEVVCGFGRTGSDFGSHHYGIKPDLITIAKGLTSAYQPLSGVIVGDRVWEVLEQGTGEYGPIGHGWTYSGHAWLCRRAGQSGDHRARGPHRQRRRDRRLPAGAHEGHLRRSSGRRPGAWRGHDGGAGVLRRPGGASSLRSVPQGRAAHVRRRPRGRSDRTCHAAGRHPRLCAAADHHARGSRRDRRAHRAGGEQGDRCADAGRCHPGRLKLLQALKVTAM